ncbi:hypothetical protein NIES2111_63150 (plasmid) [Nostoc sp. NIES-2111]|nr:hypothetical protein NIES2111_63150 [Nostoc sp. NIES-2111]
MFSIPTTLGLFLVIVGLLVWLAASLNIANLEINLQSKIGFFVLIFILLHVIVGLLLIIIGLVF